MSDTAANTITSLGEIIIQKSLVTDKNARHSYCDYFYEKELAKYRNLPIKLVEIGIDQGGSLIMWSEYFKNSKLILGMDLQLRGDCEKNCSKYNNIKFFLGNAYSYDGLLQFQDIDIFIDDGPHSLESQIWAIQNILPKINQGGIFIIEDVYNFEFFKALHAAVPYHLKQYAETVDLRHIKNCDDDMMFVVRIPGKSKHVVDVIENNVDLLNNPTGLGMDMMAERLNHIKNIVNFNNIKTIIDVGACHGYESLNMARVFTNANIYGFEPTPEQYNFCLKHFSNISDELKSRIKVENLALNDTDGEISFYPLDDSARSNNVGMASKFKLINPMVFPHEQNIQKEIKVNAVKLDTWCKQNNVEPDIIWMDAQGAELDILKGACEILPSVKIIFTEAGLKPYYYNHTMKADIDQYLSNKGFTELKSGCKLMHEYEVDTIYLNNSLI